MKLRIKQVLNSKSITTKKLAELIDKHPTYLSMVINGKKIPSLQLLQSIADALGVNIRDLFEAPKEDKSTTDLLNEIRNITDELEGRFGD